MRTSLHQHSSLNALWHHSTPRPCLTTPHALLDVCRKANGGDTERPDLGETLARHMLIAWADDACCEPDCFERDSDVHVEDDESARGTNRVVSLRAAPSRLFIRLGAFGLPTGDSELGVRSACAFSESDDVFASAAHRPSSTYSSLYPEPRRRQRLAFALSGGSVCWVA